MSQQSKTVIQNAIAANLAALAQRLNDAADLARQAHDAMQDGEQNQAIGTIISFEQLLPEASALFNAAMALHRNRL